MIEGHLEDITADVKSNLNALFERGQGFDFLASKSNDLKSHVSVIFRETVTCIVKHAAAKSKEDSDVDRADELCTGSWLVWMPYAHVHLSIIIYLS